MRHQGYIDLPPRCATSNVQEYQGAAHPDHGILIHQTSCESYDGQARMRLQSAAMS